MRCPVRHVDRVGSAAGAAAAVLRIEVTADSTSVLTDSCAGAAAPGGRRPGRVRPEARRHRMPNPRHGDDGAVDPPDIGVTDQRGARPRRRGAEPALPTGRTRFDHVSRRNGRSRPGRRCAHCSMTPRAHPRPRPRSMISAELIKTPTRAARLRSAAPPMVTRTDGSVSSARVITTYGTSLLVDATRRRGCPCDRRSCPTASFDR